jgi:phosphate transport system protein
VTRADTGSIEQQVLQLFAMVSEGLTAATDAFLSDDRDAARAIVAGDTSLDSLHSATEDLVRAELIDALQLADRRVRELVSMLQILPELERSGDLVEHIALRTPMRLSREITPLARGYICEMGRIGVEMWRQAAVAFAERDPSAAAMLRQRDDELDDLHVRLSQELAESSTPIPVAIEMGLIARFYERLGDHAVNIARRVERGCDVQPVEVV